MDKFFVECKEKIGEIEGEMMKILKSEFARKLLNNQ